ncbi:10963_t:CDS:2 [Ambispora leptoticha]|uniref:10963_t:CDS:1 n=1 Tax=Ambispora leptoticha TaxID=144679 RepID=A0A9N8VLD6_9GLOM|nr:10963_t:CDS:2 [Ambispora leptoticha]
MNESKKNGAYEILSQRLLELEKKIEVARNKLKMARLDGDRKENADWNILDEELESLQGQYFFLKNKLLLAKNKTEPKVLVTYRLLASRISINSPLGLALMNKKEGEVSEVQTEKSILVIATGKGYSLANFREQQVGLDYLKENCYKVKAIVISNTNFQNVGLLEDICQILGPSVPLYTSFHSKLIISYLFPQLKSKILNIEKNHEAKILLHNPLSEVIEQENRKKEADVYLLVVGTPPVIGGEEQLARLVDYLYTHSELITNLSKKEYLNLGASFYDFKLLIQLLKPAGVIALQNSYKNEKFFANLPGKFLTLNDGYSLDFSTRKTSCLKVKRALISLEELLLKQRENLGQSGLLIILLTVE